MKFGLPAHCGAFRDAKVVYHCAGYVSIAADDWPRLEVVNVEGTQNVVDACRASGVRCLVHFSSIEALVDTPHDLPVDETRPLVGQHATWTIANLAPRARSNHRWYREHFPAYPPERRALVPGVW